MAHFVGTNGNDNLPGFFQNNLGSDIIEGLAGADTINGGTGNDSLLGGSGADSIEGGTGEDTLRGGSENDRLFGESGEDDLFGDQGNDTIFGGRGSDSLDGGSGNDVLTAGGTTFEGSNSSIDTLRGGADNDLLISNADGTVLYNGFGGGSTEIDTLQGASSSTDTFILGTGGLFGFGGSIFYSGVNSHAVVQNFSRSDGDKVQLFGDSSLYSLLFDNRVGSSATDTLIVRNDTSDVVGIFQDTTALNLGSDILYVG